MIRRRAPLRRRWLVRDRGPCSEPGCEKPVRSKGLCATHYNRQWLKSHRMGSPEREYVNLRRRVKDRARGWCEVRWDEHCGDRYGTDMHHRQPRSRGGEHTDENCVWVCRYCHDQVHAHPKLAREKGWTR